MLCVTASDVTLGGSLAHAVSESVYIYCTSLHGLGQFSITTMHHYDRHSSPVISLVFHARSADHCGTLRYY